MKNLDQRYISAYRFFFHFRERCNLVREDERLGIKLLHYEKSYIN